MSNPSDHFYIFKKNAISVIGQSFKTLFEEKHLYQSVEVSADDLSPAIEGEIKKTLNLQRIVSIGGNSSPSMSKEQLKSQLIQEAKSFLGTVPFREGKYNSENNSVDFSVPTIRAYCPNHECKKVLPHNPSILSTTQLSYMDSKENLQEITTFSYLCQNCKKDTVTFLVRRDGLKLTLSGRTPIEDIEVPNYMPKPIRKFYKGAVIAFNSGAILPSLFMLRTTIEQHIRNAIGAADNRMTGEDLAAAYADTLDKDFNARFQSLKPVYESLSDAIHAARDNKPEIFEQEKQKVLDHFKAKEMFESMASKQK